DRQDSCLGLGHRRIVTWWAACLQGERNRRLLGAARKQVVTIGATVVANHLQTPSNLRTRPTMKSSMEASVRFLIALGAVALVVLAAHPAAAQHGQGNRGLGRAAPGRPTPPQQVPARDVAGQNANREARMTPEQR